MGGTILKIDPFVQEYEDIEDFRNIYRENYPIVYRKIMQVVHDQLLAEDLAQEVFMKLYQMDYKLVGNIPAWLYKCSLNISFNALRSKKRSDKRFSKESKEAVVIDQSSEEQWLHKDDIQTIRESLLSMEEKERNLLLMKYSGFNYKELAEIFKIGENSVGTLLARAKRKLTNIYKQKRGMKK